MSSHARRGLLAAVLVLVLLGAAFGVRSLWHIAKSHLAADGCTVGSYDIDTGQAAVASTMVSVVTKRGLPERAAVLAVAGALQESKLRNLAPGEGDRDSVGVLQQRPSQGWGGGDAAKLTDVSEATIEFLDALIKVPGWQQLQLAVAIQKVQISADGGAYAQHEPEAQALSDALTGKSPAAITCSFGKPSNVAPVATVIARLTRDLPVNPPTSAGLTVRVPGAAWQTAAWFVAHAASLGIDQVAYNARQWTRTTGWKAGTSSAAAVVATMYQK